MANESGNESMSQEELESICMEMDAMMHDPEFMRFISVAAKAVSYEPFRTFDAKAVAARFYKKGQESKRTEENEPNPLLRFGNVPLFKRNDIVTDKLFFINLFLRWGNNLTKIMPKFNRETAAVVRHKINAYGILMEGEKNAPKNDTNYLTLARLSEAFARSTVTMILRKQMPGKLNSGSKLFLTPLPILLQHTIFPAVIPKIFTEEFKQISIVLNIDFSILFCAAENKSIQQTKTLSELMNSSEKYVEDMMKRSVMDEDTKIEKMVEAGLLELDETGSGSEAQEKRYKPTAVAMELINQLPNINCLKRLSYNEAVAQIQAKK